MQVILKEDVPVLGKAGEVVRVAEGFGRNYLLPRKKAVVATDSNLKRLEQEKQGIEVRREKTRQEAEVLGQKISSAVVSLEKQAGEEDKIFGSVAAREIAAGLEAQGIKVDRKLILMKGPIRKLGEHLVEVHLHGDVVAPLKVVVTKK